jgi:4-amino-4-deoxy-L-arabinose transferase-like glycosyltransferase
VFEEQFIREQAPLPKPTVVEPNWTLRFWILFVVVAALRVAHLFILGHNFGGAGGMAVDLIGDEAYYWDWGRQLSWGYFSKPPLIAWMMALGGWTGDNTAFGLRIWVALLSCGTMLFVWLLALRMYGKRVAFYAVAFLAAMPGGVLLGSMVTIDAPLVFFWCAALFAFYGFVKPSSCWQRLCYALALLVVLGVGHLAKQIMWTFPLLGIVYLAFGKADERRALRSPLLWGAFLLSYLSLLPTVLWNSKHGWITFKHTGHHFQGDGFLKFPQNIGEFLGTQLGALSPITAVILFTLVIVGAKRFLKLEARERFLVTFSGVPLAVMLLMTLRQGLNANWAAAFYPAGLVLLAAWADSPKDLPGLAIWNRFHCVSKIGLWIGVAMCLLVFLASPIIQLTGMQGARQDPYLRQRGWTEYAAKVNAVRERMPRTDTPIFVVGHRYYASELAFYLPDQPRVYQWAEKGEIDSQYQIWGGLVAFKGQEVLVVMSLKNNVKYLPESIRAAFDFLRPVDTVEVNIGNGRVERFQLFYGRFIGLPWSAEANPSK